MNIDNLTIGQARELVALFEKHPQGGKQTPLANEGVRVIAVLQRGWVVAGKYSQDGDVGMLSDASVVRRWGTTKGLGELAMHGPLENTILDPCPPVRFHIREVVMVMECADAWGK